MPIITPTPKPEPWWRKVLGRVLPPKELHEATALIEGFTMTDAEKFISVAAKLAPVILQSEEVMNGVVNEVQAAYDAYHAAGSAAVRKAAGQ